MNTTMNEKLSFKERLCYGLGDYSNNLLTSSISAFLLIYYTNVVGISPVAAASVIAVSKIFDGISDLCMGVIVDRTNSRYGKARPWLLRLCLPLAAALVLMFSVPEALGGTARLVYIFLSYNIVSTLLYTGISVPYAAMNGLLTANQYERGILGSLRMLMGVAATMTVNTVVLKLVLGFGGGDQYDRKGWTMAYLVIGLLMVICYMVSFLFCRERVTENFDENGAGRIPVLKSLQSLFTNRYWILIVVVMFFMYLQMACFFGSMVYYAQYVLGDVASYTPLSNTVALSQIATMLCAPFLMKKIGKRNTLLLGISIAALGFAGAGLAPAKLSVQLVFSVIKGVGSGCGAATMFGMLQDTITYGQWKNGYGSSGLGNAACSFCTKLGSGAGAAMLGLVLSAGGFQAVQSVQTAGAKISINALFSYIPAVLMVFAFICVYFYDLDKKYDKIMADIQEQNTKS